MRIGIVTTWFERGAAYVSRIYKELLEMDNENSVYIYARGGEMPLSNTIKWNEDYVTRDLTWRDTRINTRKFFAWLKKYKIEVCFFNEQQDFRIVAEVKKRYPYIKLGAYVDYYTERTIKWYKIYDFVICNTHRHMQAMFAHPQSFYVQWGTNIEVYTPTKEKHDELIFFHSAGMSKRKGTDVLIDAFVDGKLYMFSKLVIHTQIPVERFTKYSREFLKKYNIEFIEKTVTAPGLYFMGDIYVYPTRLDGLGLTMYEAIASGMPVIATDFPPMNEVIKKDFGKLIKVKDYCCRQDAYYYPMALVDKYDLIECMKWYINHPLQLQTQKEKARCYAEKYYDISKRSDDVIKIFKTAKIREIDLNIYNEIMRYYRKEFSKMYIFFDNYNLFYKLKLFLINIINKKFMRRNMGDRDICK